MYLNRNKNTFVYVKEFFYKRRPIYSAVHLSRDKCVGPTTCVIFLGIELDSVRRTARLPTDKHTELIYLLEKLPVKRSCRLKDLQSLVGN